jgi:acetoin utilization deacetylase AcuC-like enzyme
VLVSAGFDAHLRDPLGGMRVSTEGYGCLARVLLRIARDCAAGRFAAVLEGGYDLHALADSVGRVLDEMGGEQLEAALPAAGAPGPGLARIRAAQGRYWELPEA